MSKQTAKPTKELKTPVIHLKDVKKGFRVGGKPVAVLRGINFSVAGGEFVVIFGPSGCGKSTLLNTILGLERPTTGSVYIHGRNIFRLSKDEQARLRNKTFGMLYQQSHWISSLNVVENVAFPLMISGHDLKKTLAKAERYLEMVGMVKFRHYHPAELSGGQQQKVGLARSLITSPEILVADEPTGNLDTKSGWEVIRLLQEFISQHASDEHPKIIMMVTHNVNYVGVATERLAMEDGLVVATGEDVIPIATKSLELERRESKVKFENS